MLIKTTLLLFLLCPAALSAPAVHVCDTSVLGKGNPPLTLRGRSTRSWTAFSGAHGAALCVHNNKYLLFTEPLAELDDVNATPQRLTVEFKSSSDTITAYRFELAGLNDKIQPYRGEAAGLLASYMTVARPGAGPSIAGARPGADFAKNFTEALGDYAKTNWLWSSEKVRKNVIKAVEAARKKMSDAQAQACAPRADVRLAFSRATLSKYIEAVANKNKAALEPFGKPAVTMVCTAPGEPEAPVTALTVAALLGSFQ